MVLVFGVAGCCWAWLGWFFGGVLGVIGAWLGWFFWGDWVLLGHGWLLFGLLGVI